MFRKLYYLVKIVFLLLQYTFSRTRSFFINLRTKFVKNNWYVSRNNNFYNPQIGATVYKSGQIWKIAKDGSFFGEFDKKNEAMESIFNTWLSETGVHANLSEIRNELESIGANLTRAFTTLIGYGSMSEPIYNEIELRGFDKKEVSKSDVNINANFFFLAQTDAKCFRCKKEILVNAIVLPEGFEVADRFILDDIDNLQDRALQGDEHARHLLCGIESFVPRKHPSILSYVLYISDEALKQIYNITNERSFQKRHSSTFGHSYYRTVCPHCDSAQGDHYLISICNSPFRPLASNEYKQIDLYKILQPIQLCAAEHSVGYGDSGSNQQTMRYLF